MNINVTQKNNILTVDTLSKSIRLRRNQSLFKYILQICTKKSPQEKALLTDISFHVQHGEIFGIIGRNGSGKTTLLRIIAGIIKPTSGHVQMHGSSLYLSGFGNGFNKKLSLNDNIIMYSSLMGVEEKLIQKYIDSILDFAELSDKKDTPLGNLSDGAVSRLSFATIDALISITQPDTLLLDEVLGAGGGDIFFQEKAKKRIKEIVKKGITIITVSHSLPYIKENCDRVLLLEKGSVVTVGRPQETLETYREIKNPKTFQ